MNTVKSVMLRWYDESSREGIFLNTLLEPVFANFELEPESHEIASKARTGDCFKAEVVSDTTFTQIKRLVKE